MLVELNLPKVMNECKHASTGVRVTVDHCDARHWEVEKTTKESGYFKDETVDARILKSQHEVQIEASREELLVQSKRY